MANDRGAMEKLARLLQLARHRRSSRWLGYKCIGDYHAGAYECDHVSPYTKSAHNVDASVMVLLQDWASDAWLSGALDQETQRLGYTPAAGTNIQLKSLLQEHLRLGLEDVFATNVFPFVKEGPMNAPIPTRDLVRAAREFALPQVGIVQPLIAVCLGKSGFNAVRLAAGAKAVHTLEEALRSPFFVGPTEVWCQAHTGPIGTNNRNKGGVNRVSSDWARMASAYFARMPETSQE